jgi:hypothetical protein
MDLTTLEPPPSSLEPDAPPPWPEPTGKFVEPTLPQESTGCGFLASALIPTAFMFFTAIEGNYGLTKFAAAAFVTLILIGWLKLRQAKALRPAHKARFERSRRCWARVKSSKVKEERHNRGVLSHYVLDLELELWERGGAETPHRSAPKSTPLHAEAKVPAPLGPQVVPGAFFAVMFDPVERNAIPFTLLTRDGAQFAV